MNLYKCFYINSLPSIYEVLNQKDIVICMDICEENIILSYFRFHCCIRSINTITTHIIYDMKLKCIFMVNGKTKRKTQHLFATHVYIYICDEKLYVTNIRGFAIVT